MLEINNEQNMDTLSLDNSQAKFKKLKDSKNSKNESFNETKKKKVSILMQKKFTD